MVVQWLQCRATNQKVADSIPDGVTGIFFFIIIIINILTAIGLAPGGSSPVHIYREH